MPCEMMLVPEQGGLSLNRPPRTAAGNPFAPPGTLRSRPVSPFMEPAPCHGRSLSLQAPDLPVPTSAALIDCANSLSLPHTSHTVRHTDG